MKCIHCGCDTKVVTTGWASGGSRIYEKDGKYRRRRECISCKKRFTTFESHESMFEELPTTPEVPVEPDAPARNPIAEKFEKLQRQYQSDNIEISISQIREREAKQYNLPEETLALKIIIFCDIETIRNDPCAPARFIDYYGYGNTIISITHHYNDDRKVIHTRTITNIEKDMIEFIEGEADESESTSS